MAYEAFFQVANQISGDYARRRREDDLLERQREQQLADVASERAYQDQVRDEDYQRKLKIIQKQADVAIETEIRKIKALSKVKLEEEAASFGVPLTNIDGTPRARSEVEDAIIAAKYQRAQQEAVLKARAEAGAALDPTVRAAARDVAVANTSDQLAVADATRPARQAGEDAENARLKGNLQSAYDQAQADLNKVLTAVQKNPAVSDAFSIGSAIHKQVMSRLDQSSAVREKQLRDMGFTTADLNDGMQLAAIAQQMGIPVDASAMMRLNQVYADTRGRVLLTAVTDALQRMGAAQRTAIERNISLDVAASPYEVFMSPAGADTDDRDNTIKLPDVDTANSTQPAASNAWWSGGLKGVIERNGGVAGAAGNLTRNAAGVVADAAALPGRVLDNAGRYTDAALNGFWSGDFRVPEKGFLQYTGERLGDTLVGIDDYMIASARKQQALEEQQRARNAELQRQMERRRLEGQINARPASERLNYWSQR